MPLPKLFKQTLTLGIFLGFSMGSLTNSFYQRSYYNHQLREERKAFLECQQAWEKYYNLTKESANPTYNLAKQIDRNEILKIKLDSLTNKLNYYGWEIEEEYLENLINQSFNQGISIIAYEISRLIPFTKYLPKYQQSKQLSKEEQQKRIYYSEVLPKCSKIKDWLEFISRNT